MMVSYCKVVPLKRPMPVPRFFGRLGETPLQSCISKVRK